VTPEERDLRRALEARSGAPSAEFRARLSTFLDAGRPAPVRTTPTLALVAASFVVIAMVGVLMLSRLGPYVSHGGPASGPRSQTTPSPAATTQPTPLPSPTPGLISGVIEKPPNPIALPADAQLSAPSNDVVWALMVNQYLYRSIDRGATWQQQPLVPSNTSPPGYPMYCPTHVSPCPNPLPTEISFVSDKEGWFMWADPWQACNAETVTVYHTTDAGATWLSLGSNGIALSQCKAGLSFVDSDRGFLSAWDPQHRPVIYRTTDGGRTWTPSQAVPAPPKAVCTDCIAMQAGVVRAFGSTLLVPVWQQAGSGPHYVFRSTDGGASWTYLASEPTDGALAIVTASRWLQVSFPQSAETTDAGTSWHPYTSDYTQAAGVAPDVLFADSLVGYATVRGGMSRTVDGGLHWTAIETPGTGITTTG
jgi:hypothetical protein